MAATDYALLWMLPGFVLWLFLLRAYFAGPHNLLVLSLYALWFPVCLALGPLMLACIATLKFKNRTAY